MKTDPKALIQIILIYLVIAITGVGAWMMLPDLTDVLRFLVSDLAMTVVCFAFSIIKKNSSVYDAYWSLIPFYFVLGWIYLNDGQLALWTWLTFAIVSLWSWRLTLNWVRSWTDFTHEDWRYINLARQTGKWYPLVNFSGIHLFPTLMVFAGMWPLFYVVNGSLVNIGLLLLGAAISLTGIGLQFFADNELARFRRRTNPNKGEILQSGLWGVCRYPNYLGEIMFWLGLAFLGVSHGAPLIIFAGAIAMMLMFKFASIPMKERRMAASRDGWENYCERVPLLFPNFKN
ncbi:MAG: steroid 5-alpha reductase family enzyme [Granulosicoccus sp.]|jgi:steroid 5-alpha reductase family enzyme